MIMGNYLNSTRNSRGKATTVDELNDDCLREIFSYLSFRDALIASKVCRNWQDCQLWHRFTSLDLIELNLSDELTTHLVSLCGGYLRHLRGRVTTNCDIVSILNENCENLESLSLSIIRCSNSSLSTLLSRNKSLKYVKLDKTGDKFDAKCLRDLPEDIGEIHLSTFSPHKYLILEEEDLGKFKELKVLSLRHFSLDEKTLRIISRSANRLLIAHCRCDLDPILENLSGIEYLDADSVRLTGDSGGSFQVRRRYRRIIRRHSQTMELRHFVNDDNKFTIRISKLGK